MATVHWIQHVPFEGLGSMEKYLTERGHDLFCTRLWAGDDLPPEDSFSTLIVMGGPMGIYDHDKYPWLIDEKAFLSRVIGSGKRILGICLGAQLLADVLGAEVTNNLEKEIGWFPVRATEEIPDSLESVFPGEMNAFHWHGDTFSIPEDAIRFFSSAACANQAFIYKEQVVGLQFHLETTCDSAAMLIDNCRDELVHGPWIMPEQKILSCTDDFQEINMYMSKLLKQFFFL